MDKLPTEIIQYIISYLSLPDLRIAAATCKFWMNQAEDVFRQKGYNGWVNCKNKLNQTYIPFVPVLDITTPFAAKRGQVFTSGNYWYIIKNIIHTDQDKKMFRNNIEVVRLIAAPMIVNIFDELCIDVSYPDQIPGEVAQDIYITYNGKLFIQSTHDASIRTETIKWWSQLPPHCMGPVLGNPYGHNVRLLPPMSITSQTCHLLKIGDIVVLSLQRKCVQGLVIYITRKKVKTRKRKRSEINDELLKETSIRLKFFHPNYKFALDSVVLKDRTTEITFNKHNIRFCAYDAYEIESEFQCRGQKWLCASVGTKHIIKC